MAFQAAKTVSSEKNANSNLIETGKTKIKNKLISLRKLLSVL